MTPVEIDGSSGEGGGQMVRSALTLSLATGKAFHIRDLRGRRKPGGLRPQHLTCVRAAETIGGAEVEGAEVGSRALTFKPTGVRPGDYLFDVGTAGSVSLLFQSVCFALALGKGRSSLKLKGGTHVTHSPSVHYLSLVWAPMMARLGWHFELELERAGFYPEGGGEVSAHVLPADDARPFTCTSRGTLLEARVLSVIGGLPLMRAASLAERAVQKLREKGVSADADNLPVPAPRSKGLALHLLARFENAEAGFYELAEGDEPNAAADRATDEFSKYMASGGAVDLHLGDQLLLPLALAAAGLRGPAVPGHYTTAEVTQHLLTHADVIQKFLDVRVAVRGQLGEPGEVVVAPAVKVE